MRTRKLLTTSAVAATLLLGGAGASLVIPGLVAAASPAASSAATAPTTTGSGTTPATTGSGAAGPGAAGTGATSAGTGGPAAGALGARPGMGGTTEAVSDASVVARAIGITETQLSTELSAGRTIAQVAAAHNVAAQTVIDALVQDKQGEIAAAVKAGTMTQAQANQELANATQFATDQVNSTGIGPCGPGGAGRPNDHDVDDGGSAAPGSGTAPGSTTTPGSTGTGSNG